MSFRSKGKVKVNEFSRKYYGGGGHINAAGGAIKKSDLNKVINELIQNFRSFCSLKNIFFFSLFLAIRVLNLVILNLKLIICFLRS